MPIETMPHVKNVKYLKVKKEKMGHLISNLEEFDEDGTDNR